MLPETESTEGDLDVRRPLLLPPPMHFGRHLCVEIRDFELPYNLWWLKENGLVKQMLKIYSYIRLTLVYVCDLV